RGVMTATTFARFRIVRKLGEGAMGAVFEAHDPQLDRRCAFKVSNRAALSPLQLERLRREAQALARIRHPRVVSIYEAGSFGGRPYLAMELVAGETLADLVARRAPRRWILELLEQAARGVQAIH